MIVLLNTATSTCHLTLVDANNNQVNDQWEAGKQLADGLLPYLINRLSLQQAVLADVKGIGVYQGPGSFTGLRIGLTVANTLAEALSVPIVGTTADEWSAAALKRLADGENDRVVMPVYGREANITTPRK